MPKCRECEFASVGKYPRRGMGGIGSFGFILSGRMLLQSPRMQKTSYILRADIPKALPFEERRKEECLSSERFVAPHISKK